MSSILDSSAVPALTDLQAIAKLTPYGAFLDEQAQLRERGEGLPHTDAKLRLFGTTEEPRITFYRDTAAWCPYCQKVWILLEEKRIPYRVEKINMRAYGDKPPSFLRLVPSGAVPAITIDGKEVMTESMEIMMYLEQIFTGPNHPSLYPLPQHSSRANRLIRLERDLFARWWDVVFRSGGMPAMQRFQEGLTIVNQELLVTDGPWFLDDFSLVDITFASLMERMVASTAYWSNLRIRGSDSPWPTINRYFEALEGRRSYLATRGDYYSHAMDLPPQCGSPYRLPGYESQAKVIEGEDEYSWRLPLPSLTDSFEVIAGEGLLSDDHSRHEAAYELASNLPAVARFACRASGAKGSKRFQAPLSDPYAVPDLSCEQDMITILSLICLTLINGNWQEMTSSSSSSLPLLVDDTITIKKLVKGLQYLRDRIGVPRDMSYPAARQLRAHLNYFIDLLLNSNSDKGKG